MQIVERKHIPNAPKTLEEFGRDIGKSVEKHEIFVLPPSISMDGFEEKMLRQMAQEKGVPYEQYLKELNEEIMKEKLENLEKLAYHLMSKKRGHKVFDFICFNENKVKKGTYGEAPENNICGTHGCAVGELPILFPERFVFSGCFVVYKEDAEEYENSADFFVTKRYVQHFFGISADEFNSLFMFDDLSDFKIKRYIKGNFKDSAGPTTVAKNILAFVEHKKTLLSKTV